MTIDLPIPLVPSSVDLRVFRRMPLDVVRLRDAETSVITKGDEFRCAVLLWCASWHQIPASSLPDDDRVLADLAGFGRVVKEWRRVRAGALRGFVKCSDGRLYHRVVAEMAIEAWGSHLHQRWMTDNARLKKHQQRHKLAIHLPSFDLWITQNCPGAKPYVSQWTRRHVPGDNAHEERGQSPPVPREIDSKGREGSSSSNQSFPGDGSITARAVPGTNTGPDGPTATPRAGGRWRTDPQAADRKMRELGLAPGRGEQLSECVRRIEQELSKRERNSRSAA
jgi:hypothetical protein